MRREDGACGGGDICGAGTAGVYTDAGATDLVTGGDGDGVGDGGAEDGCATLGKGVL